jgi:2-oxoisovalerate dehydrogenase E1 component beta subunit
MSAQQQINYGNTANDGQGDPLRTAFIKTDDNFDAIWNTGPVGSNVTILNNTVQVVAPNGNLVLAANGIGVRQTNTSVVPRFANLYDLGSANLRYRSGGQFTSPITVRSPYGGGIFGGQTHSKSPESLFTHIAGLKVVIPSNPWDAKGLLTAAIEDDDPVIFFEPKRLYNGPFDGWHQKPVSPWKAQDLAQVPTGKYVEPIGKARIMKEGTDVTILCYGTMVWVSLAGAEHAGVDAEVIDLRTLVPLDIETIEASVKKTGRCVIVHEAPKTSGFGGELSALVQERCFYHLEAPIARVTGWDTPYPHAFEWEYFPGPERVATALKAVMTGGR